MSTAIAITCIIIQTVIITGAVCYWLHIRSVRRLTSNFNTVLQETIGIITDDPRYTVKVKTIYSKSNHPVFKLSKQINSQHPYDWKTDEEFDKIINKNYPHDK